MTRLGADQAIGAHELLLEALSQLLESWSWKVDQHPLIGTVRPDLVAEDLEGGAYVFVLKTGRYRGHLGAVAQVEAYRNALRAERGREPTALLLVADDPPRELHGVAREVGITVIHGFASDQRAMIDRVTEALPEPESGPEPTVTK